MRPVRRFIFATIILTTPAQLAAQARSTALADSVRSFTLHMLELLRDRRANAVIALYGDTTHFVHVENGTVIPWSQLAPMVRTFLTTAKSNPVTAVGEPGVLMIDRNTAIVWAPHRFEASEGRPGHEGVWTGVLVRGRGGWKVVHSHSSDRRPGS